MKKRVILKLTGSYKQQINVGLRILEYTNGKEREVVRTSGKLPPIKKIIKLLQDWQDSYYGINNPSRILFEEAQVTQFRSCYRLSTQLSDEFNDLLNSQDERWQIIRDELQRNLNEKDEILLTIETDDKQIQQLPWEQWNWFKKSYSQAEIALSAENYKSAVVQPSPSTSKVKILAILGSSEGINVQADRALLEGLPNAKVHFLVEPKRQKLNEQLWEQEWDILFFAGHSSSKLNQGIICINQNDHLTIEELKYGLLKAISKGLRLAIFNSCDGLEIARDLSSLNLPHMIVMREPVPDKVAAEFLKYFLQGFAQNKSFYLAVREAREKLQGLEEEFPCASWLPVIFQNPTEVAPTWKELCNSRQKKLFYSSTLFSVLLFSVVATALIMSMRWLGFFQPFELQAFDQFMRWRPQEPLDSRIVLITVTEKDLQLPQQLEKSSLPDAAPRSLSDVALNQILEKLEQFQPKVIGLDIYRDFPADPKLKKLATLMRQNESLITICKQSDTDIDKFGIAPPPEIPLRRLGFSDFIPDSDQVLRRQLLINEAEPKSPCVAPYAFSIQVVFRYLAAQEILPKYTSENELQLNDVVLRNMTPHFGGYQQANVSGYQLMLNYRAPDGDPENIALQITLDDLLNGEINPTTIKDKVVLIGTTANNSFRDLWGTPYSGGTTFGKQIPGVVVQAQMVSQILSAVLEKRTMIWVFPSWGEVAWVFVWSLTGGTLFWKLKQSFEFGSSFLFAFVVLSGLSYGLFLIGCWVPFFPAALGLVGTSVCAAFCVKAE